MLQLSSPWPHSTASLTLVRICSSCPLASYMGVLGHGLCAIAMCLVIFIMNTS